MARKQITAVRLVEGAPAKAWQIGQIEQVTWVEDGKAFPHEEPREAVARAINSGEPFYVRTPDGKDAPVRAQLRHGKYFLTATADAAQPDPMLSLPAHPR